MRTLIPLLLVLGCNRSPDRETDDTDTGDVAYDGCRATPAAADRVRHVVIGHPYDADAAASDQWEVLSLDEQGALATTGQTFAMGRAPFGEIVFTPDGSLGLVAQDDGTLGVFTLDQGVPTVVEARFAGEFWASGVAVDPSGERAWIVDGNWRENGGGLYEIALDCADGTPTLVGKVAESKLAAALLWDGDGRAVLVADEALDATGDDAYLLAWGDAPEVLGGAALFPDDDAIVSSATLSSAGHLLVGDNSAFSGIDNRVAVAHVGDDGVEALQVLTPLEDPMDLVVSPWSDAALVVSGFGDALFGLSYDPSAAEPFAIEGELAYSGGRPELPAGAVPIERGGLEGLVLIAENTGVRRVRFDGDGGIEDLGRFGVGDGVEAIVGAIGVQP